MARPVNGGVGGLKPGQPKDNIFPTTRHDMEEIFLCNAFYVDKEDASEVDFPIFVEVWLMFCTLMGILSFMVERKCFLTNCQLMQEMSVPLLIRVRVLTTFNM